MSAGPGAGPVPPRVVPTLTEVVQVTAPRPFGAAPPASSAAPAPAASAIAAEALSRSSSTATAAARPAASLAPSPPSPALDQALSQRLLLDVQRQVDLLLEQRLRETLSPLIARLTDELVSQARDQLAATLRELITQAVAREMARRREP